MSKRAFHLIITMLFILTSAYAQPELDVTFNSGGTVTTDFLGGADIAYEVLVQPDNKIVAVGSTTSSGSQPRYFALTRYNTDGSLDTSFGDNGRVITDFDANGVVEAAVAAAIQPDGKIIAAGYVSLISPGPGYFAIARYNADGSLDTAFGNGGKASVSIVQHINELRAIAVGSDGKIVAAGYYFTGTNFQTLIACFSPNGTLQWTKTDFQGFFLGDWNAPEAVAIQPDGKIITAGSFRTNSAGSDIKLVRYNTDGSYDVSFGAGGALLVSSPNVNEYLNAIAIQPDGRIIAGGASGSDFLLVRLWGSGAHDITFSDDGRVTTSMGGTAEINGIHLKPDGKILVAGRSGVAGQGFAAVLYQANGSPDNSFSGDGKLDFGFNGASAGAESLAVDNLGRPVLGGVSNNMFAVARLYTLDPMPVTIGGRVTTGNGRPVSGLTVVLTNSQGVSHYALTSTFGYYQFEAPTGQTYTISVSSKRYISEPVVFGLNEALNDLNLLVAPREDTNGRGMGLK